MKIVVCVKQVPDSQALQGINAAGRLIRGEDDVLNELDENAIEAAVSLAEEHDAEVLAVTMGPEDSSDVLRRALQMDCDYAYQVYDNALAGADVKLTAQVLAATIKYLELEHGNIDLVVLGMASSDGMTGLLPGALAACLKWPLLSLAKHVQMVENKLVIERQIEGISARLQTSLPAVLSVTDQVNEPRYPNFRAIQAAKKKPLEELDLGKIGFVSPQFPASSLQVVESQRLSTRSGGKVMPDTGAGGLLLAQWLREQGFVSQEGK